MGIHIQKKKKHCTHVQLLKRFTLSYNTYEEKEEKNTEYTDCKDLRSALLFCTVAKSERASSDHVCLDELGELYWLVVFFFLSLFLYHVSPSVSASRCRRYAIVRCVTYIMCIFVCVCVLVLVYCSHVVTIHVIVDFNERKRRRR